MTSVVPIDFPLKYASSRNHSGPLYEVKQYKIVKTGIPLPQGVRGQDLERVWARGQKSNGLPELRVVTKAGIGQPLNLPLYRNVHWAKVTGYTTSTFDVETYIYEIRQYGSGSNLEWIDDISPDDLHVSISVLQRAAATGISESERSSDEFLVYPTAVECRSSGTVTARISSVSLQNASIIVCDILGRKRLKYDVVHSGYHNLDISSFSPGVYNVMFRNGSKTMIKSIHVY